MSVTPIAALHYQAAAQPKGVALIEGDDSWTYERLAGRAKRLARGFLECGIRRGDRIALHMPNSADLAAAYYACFHIGAIAVPLNNGLKAADLKSLLQRVEPALYVGHAAHYNQVGAIAASLLPLQRRFITDSTREDTRAQPWENLLGDGPASVPVMYDVHSPAALFATSGTTGVPKFVIHTHTTLAATVDTWEHFGLDGDQTAMIASPMVHFAGFATLAAGIRFGATVVLLEVLDPDCVLDAMERARCTWSLGTVAAYTGMVRRQVSRARDIGSLRTCLTVGDGCSRRLQVDFSSTFGIPLRSTWVATEVAGSLTYGLEPGPVNRIVTGAQVRLVDDHGTPVAPGKVGELLVRGPNVSIGYWGGPGVIEGEPKNGWYHTGDLMRQDTQGNLRFVSRKKDLVSRGESPLGGVMCSLAGPVIGAQEPQVEALSIRYARPSASLRHVRR
jgi:long-chain acyl-CoA synthetase